MIPCFNEVDIPFYTSESENTGLVWSLSSVSEGSSIIQVALSLYEPAIAVATDVATIAGIGALLKSGFKKTKEKLNKKVTDSETLAESSEKTVIITEFNFRDELNNNK